MNARFAFAAGVLLAAIAAFSLAPRSDAQSSGNSPKGVFSTLRVGQMVEFKIPAESDAPVITTYEDEETKPLMRHKVKEVGHDYLALEYDDRENSGSISETRFHASRILMVGHVSKSKKGGASADEPDKTGKTGSGKTTKKKN